MKDVLKIYNGNGVANAGVVDSRTGKPMVNFIDAGGSSGATECVWYVWNQSAGHQLLIWRQSDH